MRALSYRTEAVIRRPPEDVFDYCSDLRTELQWNPKAKYVEKLTDGPVGVGTRSRAQWSNSGPATVEVVQVDRPRRWETHATARGMGVRFKAPSPTPPQGRATPPPWSSTPRAWPGWLRPLALLAMRRQDQKNMRRIREARCPGAELAVILLPPRPLEGSGAARDRSAGHQLGAAAARGGKRLLAELQAIDAHLDDECFIAPGECWLTGGWAAEVTMELVSLDLPGQLHA